MVDKLLFTEIHGKKFIKALAAIAGSPTFAQWLPMTSTCWIS